MIRDLPNKYPTGFSIAIFVVMTVLMGYLRLHIYREEVISLTYGLPLLICLWHRDRRLLWSMAVVFCAMAAYKAMYLLPARHSQAYVLTQWVMQVANVAIIGGTVHALLNRGDRLRAKNAELEQANAKIASRADEISRQNEELQAQGEELAQQNEEIQVQSEELAQQNEEFHQQAEELQSQTEELQSLNLELFHREAMLNNLLESVRSQGDERKLLQSICDSLLQFFRTEATAAAVLERTVDDNILIRAHSGLEDVDRDRWPFRSSFAAVIMEQRRTAYVEDLATRPDLIVPHPRTGSFASVLAAPWWMDGKPAGVVKVYSPQPRKWTAKQFQLLEWVAGHCSLILEARRLREQMARTNSQLEALVEERTAKLQELVDELEHFSYTITHDMRAPLRAMQGFAFILQQECTEFPNDECRDYLNRIITAAARMDRLITDALSYSQSVRQEMPALPVDPAELLRGMIESYPMFQEPHAEVVIDPKLPMVLANEAGLTQCFSNLLNNAIKFVAPGQRPRVRVRAESMEEWVRLWIEDNGIGIPEEMQPGIFRMFQRASRDYEGTGIGLALVRKVTERMGGRIGVDSRPGDGSRFWIELRSATPPTPPSPSSSP